MLVASHVGSARRRRERRLRSFLRHEWMAVRMELAAALHHSSFRGAGPEMYDAPRRQRTTNSRVDLPSTVNSSSDDGRPTGGERPAALSEPWPQGKMERHDGIAYELVQALDAPVLQTMEQLPNVATQLSVVCPSRLSKCRRSCLTMFLRDVRVATRQLVEVPTPVSYTSFVAADCGAARRHSSSCWWRAKRWSSRFSPRTEFNLFVFFFRTHF